MALLGDGAAPLSLCCQAVAFTLNYRKARAKSALTITGCVVLGRWLAYQKSGGKEDLKLCFTPSRINKFWYIGMIYAMGDIF